MQYDYVIIEFEPISYNEMAAMSNLPVEDDLERPDVRLSILGRIDNYKDDVFINRSGRYKTKIIDKLKAPEIFPYEHHYNKFFNIISQEKQKTSNLHYHQQHFKVFEDIYINDLSITDYTKLVDNGYYSVYNSYTKAKKIIKDKLLKEL